MKKNKNTKLAKSDKTQKMTCPDCGRPLVYQTGVGFGTEKKLEPCICDPLSKSCSGRTGWGN